MVRLVLRAPLVPEVRLYVLDTVEEVVLMVLVVHLVSLERLEHLVILDTVE